MSEDWERYRRARTKSTIDPNAERVLVTEDNVKQVAKQSGRSEYELRKMLAEADSKGYACHVRLVK